MAELGGDTSQPTGPDPVLQRQTEIFDAVAFGYRLKPADLPRLTPEILHRFAVACGAPPQSDPGVLMAAAMRYAQSKSHG